MIRPMFRPYRGDGPEPVGFLLVPQFSSMAFFSAIEPLRVANRLAGRPLFSWRAYSVDGEPVEASNGMKLMVDAALPEAANLPTLIVCSSFEPQRAETKHLLAQLRRFSRGGMVLGALDTGTHLLAKAGLIDAVTVTMHWEAVPGFREEFPHIEVSNELFEIEERFFTCAGGTAAMDMMLDMITRKHGLPLAIAVSEQFILDRIRDRHNHQRMEISSRLRVTNAKVLKIVETMEANLEQPFGSRDLAAQAGVTPRQMERLFQSLLGTSPAQFYREQRLTRARQLLRQTDMRVIDIAMATGFSSTSALSRRYREQFGVGPREDRRE